MRSSAAGIFRPVARRSGGSSFRMALARSAARCSGKGALPGQHLVKHRAKAENVGARVRFLAPHLFGRHVAGGPQHHAGARLVGQFQVGGGGISGFGSGQLCQAEVQNLGAAIAAYENVLRLQIAMNNSFVVRSRQPVGDLNRVLDRFARRQRTAASNGRAGSRPRAIPSPGRERHRGCQRRRPREYWDD